MTTGQAIRRWVEFLVDRSPAAGLGLVVYSPALDDHMALVAYPCGMYAVSSLGGRHLGPFLIGHMTFQLGSLDPLVSSVIDLVLLAAGGDRSSYLGSIWADGQKPEGVGLVAERGLEQNERTRAMLNARRPRLVGRC